MKYGKLLEEGMFCKVVVDKYDEKYLIKDGDIVFLVGSGFFPISEKAPYLYKKYFAIVKVEGKSIDLSQKPLVVAPESLEKLGEEQQAELQEVLEKTEELLSSQLTEQ